MALHSENTYTTAGESRYAGLRSAAEKAAVDTRLAIVMAGRAVNSHDELVEALEAIEHALRMGFQAADILDENSPIRDGIRQAIKQARE